MYEEPGPPPNESDRLGRSAFRAEDLRRRVWMQFVRRILITLAVVVGVIGTGAYFVLRASPFTRELNEIIALRTAYRQFVESTEGRGSLCRLPADLWMDQFTAFLEERKTAESESGPFNDLVVRQIRTKYTVLRLGDQCYLVSSRYVRNIENFRFASREDGEYVRLMRDDSEYGNIPRADD